MKTTMSNCGWRKASVTIGTISTLYVPTREGKLVRLDNVVKLTPSRSVSQINRLDRQRQVTLQASVAPGFGMADRNQRFDASSTTN